MIIVITAITITVIVEITIPRIVITVACKILRVSEPWNLTKVTTDVRCPRHANFKTLFLLLLTILIITNIVITIISTSSVLDVAPDSRIRTDHLDVGLLPKGSGSGLMSHRSRV